MCRVHEIDTRFMNQSNHWIKVTDAHHYFNQVVSHPHTQKKRTCHPTTTTNQPTKGQNEKCAGAHLVHPHAQKEIMAFVLTSVNAYTFIQFPAGRFPAQNWKQLLAGERKKPL